MATPNFKSGFYGTAALGSNELAITKWDVNPMVKLQEYMNSMSGAWVVRTTTFKDVSGTMDLDFDFANNPFQSPFSVQPGSFFTNLELYLSQSAKDSLDGPVWTFASVVIDSTPQTLTVDGKVTLRVSFKGNGACTFPSP